MAGEKDSILSQCRQLLSSLPTDLSSRLEEAISGLSDADERSTEDQYEFKLLSVLMHIASNEDIQRNIDLISRLDLLIDDATDYLQSRMRQNLHRLNLIIKRPKVFLPKEMEEKRERLIRLIATQNLILTKIDTLIRRRTALKTQLKALNSNHSSPLFGIFSCFSGCTNATAIPISPAPKARPRRSSLILESKEDKIMRELSEIRDALNKAHELLIDPLFQTRVFIRHMQEYINNESKPTTTQLTIRI